MATQLTIIHRITNAFNKIGLANGTKIPDPEYTGEDQSNSARNNWLNEWASVCEYLTANTLKKIAETRADTAKERLTQAFGPMVAKLKVGDTSSVIRGNVAVTFNLRNGPTRISKPLIISVLTTKYKWKMEDITAFINEIEQRGTAMYITPSTTAE